MWRALVPEAVSSGFDCQKTRCSRLHVEAVAKGALSFRQACCAPASGETGSVRSVLPIGRTAIPGTGVACRPDRFFTAILLEPW